MADDTETPGNPAPPDNPAPAPTPPVSGPNAYVPYVSPQVAAAYAPGASEGYDATVPGGRYRTADGDFVDAWGNPYKESRKGR